MNNSFESFKKPSENTNENQERQKARIIVMLGARFFQKGEGNEFPPRFPLVLESKKEGMPKEVVGGDTRMRAIEQLYQEFEKEQSEGQNFRVFATGGTEEILLDNGETLKISRAEMAEKKLETKYGIPDELVETLPSGGSTLGNAAAIAEWVKEHKEEIGSVHEIEIVTNEFHMPRAWLMFSLAVYKNEKGEDLVFSEEEIENIETVLNETLSDIENGDQLALKKIQELLQGHLLDLTLTIKPQIAEDVLKRRGESGERYGQLIRHNEHLQQTRGFERQGIKDLVEGKYQVK